MDIKQELKPRIDVLPPRIAVAFAARSARRMLPLCGDTSRAAAESAVVAAEKMAFGQALPFFAYVHEAATASDAARRIFGQPEKSVSAAAAGAARAAGALASDQERGVSAIVLGAVMSSLHAGRGSSQKGRPNNQDVVLRDLVYLESAIDVELIDSDSLIRPGFFGPIWPTGVPLGWGGEEILDDSTLSLDFAVDAEVGDQMCEKIVQEFVRDADRFCRSHGGSGLLLEELEAVPQNDYVLLRLVLQTRRPGDSKHLWSALSDAVLPESGESISAATDAKFGSAEAEAAATHFGEIVNVTLDSEEVEVSSRYRELGVRPRFRACESTDTVLSRHLALSRWSTRNAYVTGRAGWVLGCEVEARTRDDQEEVVIVSDDLE